MNNRLLANHCLRSRTIFQAATLIASAALVCIACRSALAQTQTTNRPQKPAESRTASPSNPEQELTVPDFAHQIEAVEANLRKLQEQLGANDPAVLQAQKQAIEYLESRVRQMSPGAPNENKKASNDEMKETVAKVESQQVQQIKEQLAEREKQLEMMAKQMMEHHRQQPLPPLENGQLKVYSLVAVPARAAGQTIESLFGSQVLRIAIDERSNSLIVYGKPDSLTAVEALLSRLDEKAAASASGDKSKRGASAAPRSVLLRVFWLADGLPEGVGQNAADFLPKSVLLATNKLGLEAPRLVSQTVNSLAVGRDDGVNFATNVPAVLRDQPNHLDCDGRLKLVSDERVQLEMRVRVFAPAIVCELSGSLATPLGHYMVLGTANSLMAEGGPAAGAMAGGPGIGPGRREAGAGFGAGRPGGGYRVGPEGAPAPGASAGPEGGPSPLAAPAEASGGPGAGEQAVKPGFKSSRFAFVVQIIEGQSYPAENGKSDSK
jgi:hypothetical protein